MTNYELLLKVKGLSVARFANEWGVNRPNLLTGIQGHRPIPDEIKARLNACLGLTRKGYLDHRKIHVWKVISTGKRYRNIDALREAGRRFFDEIYLGPSWFSKDESAQEFVSVYVTTCKAGHTQYGVKLERVILCLVHRKGDEFPVSDVFENWEHIDELFDEAYPFEFPDIPESRGVPPFFFENLIHDKASFEEVEEFLTVPDIWTWYRVAYLASKKMTPLDAAKKLGVAELAESETGDEPNQ